MRSLARYATTNAITRTMLSELLTREDFESIIRSESVHGAWLALKKTAYEHWIPDDPPRDALGIEKILREVTARRFKRSAHALTGKPREVSTNLLTRWELDNLEFGLRLWHSHDTSLQEFLTYPSLVNDVPVYDITEAETIEEIALVLRHTPYFEPVSASVRIYREKHSIFFVEIALERDYYARLLDAIRGLGGTDARQAEKIVSAEIDMLNLSWLTRLIEYYEVQPVNFGEYVIPGPSEISRRLSQPDVTHESLRDLGSEFLGSPASFGTEGQSQLETIGLIESMVRESAVESARSALAGYPFSIGCVFAFYLLKRAELRNLQTVFGGKAIETPEDEILNRLYGLR
jgi:vacuolar-type H+-ATPase subunit C/Vma6